MSSLPLPRVRRALLPLLALILLAPLLGLAQPAAPARGEVVLARVHSVIHPVSAELILDAIREADASGAAAVVLELSTPGGLLTSTREITTAMLGARTPVVVWVAPDGAQNASAGFFVLMAADVAAMAPNSNTGAAHPVGGQGEDIPGKLGEKMEQDSAAYIRALAARTGRNVQLAQAAVVESRSFTAREALQGKLIELIAPTLPELLRALDGRTVRKGNQVVALRTAGASVREVELPSLRKLLAWVADPNIAYVLLVLGGLGLYFELMNPGAILPGVVGGICLILAFFALSVLPVNVAGLALILLSLLFFIAEIKVVSHGLLAVGGVISLVLGSLMLFKTGDAMLRVSLQIIASLVVFTVAVVGFLVLMALRARRAPVTTGREGLLTERGTARTPLDPRGKVFVHGELWDAVAPEPVAAGETVEIVAVQNLTLEVRPLRPRVSV
ncbi:MAG TPA: nodulation protein NfeD [Thermoanaerobaculia bacterium]|nr:nodulation protein NfeD [Thermoanaerobaculia bacterium]